jgi:hypothetical protein
MAASNPQAFSLGLSAPHPTLSRRERVNIEKHRDLNNGIDIAF